MTGLKLGPYLWAGVVGIRQGDEAQTGFMVGSRTIATAAHGLHSRQAIRVKRLDGIDSIAEQSAKVLWIDKAMDLCILTVHEGHDFWFVPSQRALMMGDQYLVVSCVDERAETTFVVNEGSVALNGIELLKLRSGQIQRGYSGAPVLDADDGRLVGMVRVTRGRQTALGGHAVLGTAIGHVRSQLGLDKDDRRMQVRRMATLSAWPMRRSLRGNPPESDFELIGRDQSISELDGLTDPRHARVIGRPLTGKSAIVAVWSRIPSLRSGDTAYVDAAASPPTPSRHAVVGMVLPILGLDIPRDPFESRSESETLALASWIVMRDLRGGRLILDLQHVSIDDSADADLAALLKAADQMNVAIIVVGREVGSRTLFAQSSTPVIVGALGIKSAAELVQQATLGRIPYGDADEALRLIDPDYLLPGEIILACEGCDDATDVAVRLEERLAASTDSTEADRDVESGDFDLLEGLILHSATDPLGIRLPGSLPEAIDARTFVADAVRLDSWPGNAEFRFGAENLAPSQGQAMREIFHNVAHRSWRPEWVQSLNERVLELEETTEPRSQLVQVCRSQVAAGDLSSARRTLEVMGGSEAINSIIKAESYLNDLDDAHLLVLAWWLGERFDGPVGGCIARWLAAVVTDQDRWINHRTRITLYDALRSLLVRPIHQDDALAPIAAWCLSRIENSGTFLSDPGMWTTYISLIGRAADLAGDSALAREFLTRALPILEQHQDLLMGLALAGDSRPLLTIARQKRRLYRLKRGIGVVDFGELKSARDLLDWAVENAPSADAFLTLLSIDPSLKLTSNGDNLVDSGIPANSSAAGTLARLRRLYKRWLKGHPGITSGIVELEYRFLRLEWRISGSLLREARTADVHWTYRPIPKKLEALSLFADARRRRLRSLRDRLGDSVAAVELEASTAAQFQTAVSIVTRTPADLTPVDAILQRGVEAFQSSANMTLLLAQHERHRRDFRSAAGSYIRAAELAVADPLTRLRALVGACESVSQAYSGGECSRDDLLAALQGAETYEGTDFHASIVCALSRLELYRQIPDAYLQLAMGLAREGGFTSLATGMREVKQTIAWAGSEALPLLNRFVDDFTDAGLLVPLSVMYIRAFELLPSQPLQLLRAALVLLDGVRIMAGTTWSAPSVNFHQGRALLLACSTSGTPDPISWDDERPDIELACAKLQGASDLSIGSFQQVVLGYLGDAQRLRAELSSG